MADRAREHLRQAVSRAMAGPERGSAPAWAPAARRGLAAVLPLLAAGASAGTLSPVPASAPQAHPDAVVLRFDVLDLPGLRVRRVLAAPSAPEAARLAEVPAFPAEKPAPAGSPDAVTASIPRGGEAPATGAAPGAERPAAVRDQSPAIAMPVSIASAAVASDLPEQRLLAVYRLIVAGELRPALEEARRLAHDVPTFQLAQLVYGDLLLAQAAPLATAGSVGQVRLASDGVTSERLAALREEAQRRLLAFRERPPAGTLPREFLRLPASYRHVIAVDASRSRLYLLENAPAGPRLVADYYVSVGKLGVSKQAEGDKRTPLGMYFVTRAIAASDLPSFYGAGALPLNYPNAYDLARGRTGGGIWLHGTPPERYAREPQASDGCVVLANPDLRDVLRRIEVRTTPVLIARRLEWVAPGSQAADRAAFEAQLDRWHDAARRGAPQALAQFYETSARRQAAPARAPAELRNLSILAWNDGPRAVRIVTFEAGSGGLRRQYWTQDDGRWRILFDGRAG